MRSSSTRLRIGGALAATSVTLVFGLGSTALAEQGQGQGDDHRNERAAAGSDRPSDDASPTPTTTPTFTEDNDTNDGGTKNNVIDDDDNAHPSGKDRSVESGGSGNQGNATSEPDQNGSGPERDTRGLDKPNGPGGTDVADQDGNNGCGNDDDFEDDNEGRCGKAVPTTTPPVVDGETEVVKTPDVTNPIVNDRVAPVAAGSITPAAVAGAQLQTEAPAQVLGVVVERPAAAAADVEAAAAPAAAKGGTAVLGATVVRGAALARTGLATSAMVMMALALLLVGFAMVRRPKGAHFIA